MDNKLVAKITVVFPSNKFFRQNCTPGISLKNIKSGTFYQMLLILQIPKKVHGEEKPEKEFH